MEILQQAAIFIVALIAVLKSAEYFTNSAEKIGLFFKIPPFIIGVTIIALGTSLPEVATSISAVFKDQSDIVIGNVVGSNMANILLVLAITAIIAKQIKVNKDIIKNDLPILFATVILLFITTIDGDFDYVDGIFSLIILLTYTIYNVKSDRKVESKTLKATKSKAKKAKLGLSTPLTLLISASILYFSANFTIDSVIQLSTLLNIGTDVIALSAIAIGTSLPELAVSIAAIRNNQADIAIGNVTGSNIFNVLGVMGIPSLFGTLSISPEMTSFMIPSLIMTTALYIFIMQDREVSLWEGITLLMIYIAFMGKIFGLI